MSDATASRRILLVDDEEDLVWSLVRRLQRALPNAVIDGKTRPEDALEALRATEYDLLVTDVRMPNMSGVELLVEGRRRWPGLPFVIMTAFPTDFSRSEAMRLGSVSYVEKPFELSSLIEIVEDVLRRRERSGFSGDVLLETLPDLVQLFSLSGLTGALHLWRDDDRGSAWFDRGNVTHAVTRSLAGVAAFYEILSWSGGEFALERGAVAPEVTIFENSNGLIIEAMRRLDEARRTAEARPSSAPPPRGKWTVAPPAVAPEANVRSESHAAGPTSLAGLAAEINNQEKAIMSTNVQNALESLRSIDGYVGSCLVDSDSGMCLGADGGGGVVNLEVAAAGNTEVVRAKRKTMKSLNLRDEIEDMLITLAKQYHIIRPMKNRPGIFFYVVVDRGRANLAMTRLALAETEKKLEL